MKRPVMNKKIRYGLRIFFSMGLCVLSCWLFYALTTYHYQDPSYLFESSDSFVVRNGAGWLGASVVSLLLFLFGFSTIFVLLFLFMMCGITARLFTWQSVADRCVGLLMLLVVSCVTSNRWGTAIIAGEFPGGYLGHSISIILHAFDKNIADFIIMVAWCITGILLLQFAWVRWFMHGVRYIYAYVCKQGIGMLVTDGIRISWQRLSGIWQRPSGIEDINIDKSYIKETGTVIPIKQRNEKILASSQADSSRPSRQTYRSPGVQFFSKSEQAGIDQVLYQEQQARARVLEQKLERFNIYGSIVGITVGPVVTLFEYQPAMDTKISTIVAREDDLALALQALSLRIIAPIPGRSVVGFEVANAMRQSVTFSSLIHHQSYSSTKCSLPLLLGQDTQGKPVIVDLATLPHLLVAGTTGSGKSVALHTMLMSLLNKYSPDHLRLLLIDPKRLEFSAYADCAHLLVPIVTDAQTAVAALRFAIRTMQERYEELASHNVRNIHEYRAKKGNTMPFIVIVIDELADLMMTAGKEIEGLLIRLAQMSRAAGIHIIIATQRPSVDIITGIIKANFPARIALKVATKVDSRTIIDMVGAERLLGKGDMLFLDGHGNVQRLHGAYVTEKEVMSVTDYIRSQRAPVYEDINAGNIEALELNSEDDALYNQVRAFLNEVDEVSISLLQRRFRIGYNRSARIIELLQSQGLIASAEAGTKTRRVIRSS